MRNAIMFTTDQRGQNSSTNCATRKSLIPFSYGITPPKVTIKNIARIVSLNPLIEYVN